MLLEFELVNNVLCYLLKDLLKRFNCFKSNIVQEISVLYFCLFSRIYFQHFIVELYFSQKKKSPEALQEYLVILAAAKVATGGVLKKFTT